MDGGRLCGRLRLRGQKEEAEGVGRWAGKGRALSHR